MSRQPMTIRDEITRQLVASLIMGLSLEKPWQVTVQPVKKRRTLSQNNLYWSWVEKIAQETGNDRDDVHEALKGKFAPARSIALGDETATVLSTARLETDAMSAYMDKVYHFAASELGILLPLPEELGRAA